jgi:uncharacterized protein (TIGR03437 family)
LKNTKTAALLALCVICVEGVLHGQAVNAASGASEVAPGSLVSVYGNFAVGTGQARSIPLPTSTGAFYFLLWNGVSLITDTVPNRIPLLYWSPTQINVLLPNSGNGNLLFNSVGSGNILVGFASGTPRGTVALNVIQQAPGIFLNPTSDCSILPAGCGQKLIRGILTDANYTLIASGNPARPRQSLVIWVTGLGITPTAPQVTLSGAGAPVATNVFYSGHTSYAGLDQVNVTLPDGDTLVSGCAIGARVELQLSMRSTLNGYQSNAVSLPIVTDTCK